MKKLKLTKKKPGSGPAVEVFRARGLKPTKFAYRGIVKYKGKKMQQRLGFRRNQVVEVAYVPLKRNKLIWLKRKNLKKSK
jgi:hypothetical protein